MYLYTMCTLFLTITFGEGRKINEIEKRIKILERKFAIHEYESELAQSDFLEIKNRLSEMENNTDISVDLDKQDNSEHKVIDNHGDSDNIAELNSLAFYLLKAFQDEKMLRQDLQKEFKQIVEDLQAERETLHSKIALLESNQLQLKNMMDEQAKETQDSLKMMSEKVNILSELFMNLKEKDFPGQIQQIDTKIDSFKEMVKANATLLAESTDDKFRSMMATITKLPDQLRFKHVSFSARLANNIDNIRAWDTVVFEHALTNIGNAYSTTTGEFTAPDNGVYLFYIHILGSSRALEMCLRKNREKVLWLYAHGPGHGQDGNMVILQLSKGDKVKVVKHGPWGTSPFYVHSTWTNFAGTLLYPL